MHQPPYHIPRCAGCKVVVPRYAQCGGLTAPKGVKGVDAAWATYCCAAGFKCKMQNKYYYQCL
jgi:hypothetical protein